MLSFLPLSAGGSGGRGLCERPAGPHGVQTASRGGVASHLVGMASDATYGDLATISLTIVSKQMFVLRLNALFEIIGGDIVVKSPYKC